MHKTKRPLSFVLAVLMIVGIFAAVPFTASAIDAGYTVYELALGLPNPDVIKDCTYQYYFYYANVPIIDPEQDETFSTLPDGDIVAEADPHGLGIIVGDAKGYAYKFYDNTGAELPASMTNNEIMSGSDFGFSADVILYRKTFSITFTQAAMDSEGLYIVAAAPATDPDVENVIALINAIGDVTYTAESKALIDDARAAYDALSDDQKALVTNADALTTAETTYANLKAAADEAAANNVTDKITAIGTVEFSAGCKAAIDEARAAYDALTDTQKPLVDNYDTLTAAETAYANLKNQADQAAADAVIEKIDAIGTVAYTAECKAKIDEARAEYDALTDAQKALVTNVDILTTAETAYAALAPATYTVTWQNADGTVLETDTDVVEGTTPEYNGATPTKASSTDYKYTFTGWTPEVTAVTEDTTYVATYKSTFRPKYKITISHSKSATLIASTPLPYSTTAAAIGKKIGYGSYTPTGLSHYKLDKIGTISGKNYTINTYGTEQLSIKYAQGTITPKVICTPITPCACEATGYTGTYDGEAHTIEGLTVTLPESGATVKYGTVSGTYNLTEPPTFTDVGTHTVYYQVSASGWVTKTGSVNVVINPKSVTVTAIAQSKIRGTDDPELTYTVDGLLGEDTLTGELAREEGEEIGTYAISQGTLDVGSNYAIEYIGANLTIEPNADDIAAAEVSALIDTIGEVSYTDECKDKIDAAREAYDALTDAQKTLVDNYATLTDAETTYAVAKYGQDWQSVTIADQITINFLLDTAAHDGMQSITITYTNQDKEPKTLDVDVNDLVVDEASGCYRVPAIVAPAQIGDTVTINIVEADGSETKYSTSIADYCKYLLDGDFSAEVKALAAATLEYGQAANDYFGYADAFATTDAAQAAIADVAGLENHMSVTTGGKIKSISYMALTKPEFRFYVDPDCGLTEADFVALNDKITVSGNASAQFVKNVETGAVMLEVTEIKAENMDEVITITIEGFGEISFCGNDFARLLAMNGATATLGAALYNYGAAANALFA